ncbi:signal peptidase II [Buchnera aphidicola]|uniref:Lipoprotein signal peptidase n=1 Tax=Buchnera aphidicola (Lipaphis pseudobrassicae) TaxID=1258543 RepID=A0A4D6Y795_9GAMM|nr:signal peptidase II [Buchnera aphidicola]QCI22031.1 signal peptidase II [Buchnera aphidicola (Lipaphis pseudobrassicae)]
MKTQYLKRIKKWIYTIIIISIVIIDIFSKNWIANHIKIDETKKIFSILNLTHIHNYGAAFSFLSNQEGWQRWFLSTVSICTILVMTSIIIKSKKIKKDKIIAYSLIISGAIGNLIDRVLYGFVIDFIDMHINDWHFATFNIADCSIFLGILILTRINY